MAPPPLLSALLSRERIRRVTRQLATTLTTPSSLPWRLRAALHGTHALAWSALMTRGTKEAMALLAVAARALPVLPHDGGVHAALVELAPFGTCLSRCVSVAMMAPAVEVVIGVRLEANVPSPLSAHAWLECEGRVVPGSEARGAAMARMRVSR